MSFMDLEPFEVALLHTGHTILQKRVLIHVLAQQHVAKLGTLIDRRSGRRFYDVFQLLADWRVLIISPITLRAKR
jgi:hypothetical protein